MMEATAISISITKKNQLLKFAWTLEGRTVSISSTQLNREANQCNFINVKHLHEEAEVFLGGVFAHLLTSYGADYCKCLLGGDGHVRREAKVKTTPKIAEYLQNLCLTLVADIVQKRETGLLMPPQNKRRKVPIVVYSKGQGTTWGSKLHDEELTTDTWTAPSVGKWTAPASL